MNGVLSSWMHTASIKAALEILGPWSSVHMEFQDTSLPYAAVILRRVQRLLQACSFESDITGLVPLIRYLPHAQGSVGSRSGGSRSSSFLPTHDAVDCGIHEIQLIRSSYPEINIRKVEVVLMAMGLGPPTFLQIFCWEPWFHQLNSFVGKCNLIIHSWSKGTSRNDGAHVTNSLGVPFHRV